MRVQGSGLRTIEELLKKHTVTFRKNERNIFFHILTECNLRCRHCYINPVQHGTETLPSATVIQWLKHLFDEQKETNIVFLGGEPTLHPQLDLCVKGAKDIGYRSITIDTNGYLFNDILKKVTPDEVDYFNFSLDGATEQTNDAIRGKGCYRNCTQGIKKAASADFRVNLIYTVSRLNIHELEKMPPLLKDLGIERFFIQVIGIRGRPSKKGANLQLTKDEWTGIVPRVAAEAVSLGIDVTYPKVFLEKGEPFECAGLVAENFFIFPNGRVYQCPLCEDFPIHSFVISEESLTPSSGIRERELFQLTIPEGCVMNRILQPANLRYNADGTPEYRIACCLLKESNDKGE